MKTIENKNRAERTGELKALAAEVRADGIRTRRITIGAIEVLQASHEVMFLDDDLKRELQQAKHNIERECEELAEHNKGEAEMEVNEEKEQPGIEDLSEQEVTEKLMETLRGMSTKERYGFLRECIFGSMTPKESHEFLRESMLKELQTANKEKEQPDPGKMYNEHLNHALTDTRNRLNSYRVSFQKEVLETLLAELSEKEREEAEENRREDAINKLHDDVISQMDTDNLIEFVKKLKNNGRVLACA